MDFNFPDVFCWIQNLPPISQWETNSIPLNICSSTTSQPLLNLTISKTHQSSKLSFIIVADFNIPMHLWTSKPLKPSSTKTTNLLDEETISNLFINFVQDIFHYGSNKNSPFIRFPKLDSVPNLSNIFNLTFFTLLLLICIYEAPKNIRATCISILKDHLTGFQSRQASNLLMKILGSNLQEQWMRSVNLGITNWVGEARDQIQNIFATPCSLFSYAFSTYGLWKVQLYCPALCMDVEKSKSNPPERLQFSLKYHQVEGVLQFNYKVVIEEKWLEIMVNVDNIR